MNKTIRVVLVVIFLNITVLVNANDDSTFIKEYTYNASDDDSKNSSRKKAIIQLKALLSEEIGIHIVNDFEIIKNSDKNGYNQRIKKNLKTMSANFTKLTIMDEKWNGKTYYIKASVAVDKKKTQEMINSILKNKNIPKIESVESFDFSLHPGIGWKRNPMKGEKFNTKMSSFLGKTIYLSIAIPKKIYSDSLQTRDGYGRIIFTVHDNLDEYGSEYLIHLMPNDPDPFVFMDDITMMQGYYKIYDINGPRQGYMSVNIRPARNY